MRKKAFTLIELMVVMMIIAVLGAIVVISVTDGQKKSRDARRLADMKQVQTAIDLYFIDNKYFPPQPVSSTTAHLGFGWTNLMATLVPQYMNKSIADPNLNAPYTTNYIYKLYDPSKGDASASMAQTCKDNGRFYVLAIKQFEKITSAEASNPAWPCVATSDPDWGPAPQWVTGKFEK